MTMVIEDFVAKLGWDIDNSKLVKFNQGLRVMDKSMTRVAGGMYRGVKKSFTVAAIGATALGGAIALVAREFSKIEDAQAAFTPLLGSVGRAKEMVEALNQTAATTPFQFVQLAGAAKQLLPNMGGDIQKTIALTRMLGDTAGGNALRMDSIVRGYNKALLKGKVDMESLNMIAEAGVPIFNTLGDTVGLKGQKMFKAISAGKVSTEQLTAAFRKMTGEGGMFFEGMKIASGTLSGKISTLKDNVSLAGAEIGKVFAPYLKALTERLIEVAKKAKDWVHQNRELIRTKIVDFIKKIPYYLEQIKYWVPKIAKLVVVFLAITAVVKAATVAMNAFLVVKAIHKYIGGLKGISNFFSTTLPAATLKSKSAIGSVGKAMGVLSAFIIGLEIGTLIHDELVEPFMAARHEAERLRDELDDTIGGDLDKRSAPQLQEDLKQVSKLEKIEKEKGVSDYIPFLRAIPHISRFLNQQETTERRGALEGAIAKKGGGKNVAQMMGSQAKSAPAKNVTIAKVENNTTVNQTNASAGDIERGIQKGMERALEKARRNMADE